MAIPTLTMPVAVTPYGRHVVSGSQDNTLRLWDLESGKQVSHFHRRE